MANATRISIKGNKSQETRLCRELAKRLVSFDGRQDLGNGVISINFRHGDHPDVRNSINAAIRAAGMSRVS